MKEVHVVYWTSGNNVSWKTSLNDTGSASHKGFINWLSTYSKNFKITIESI